MADTQQNLSKSLLLQILEEVKNEIKDQIRELGDKSYQERRQYFKKDELAYRKTISIFNQTKTDLINTSVYQVALKHNIDSIVFDQGLTQFFNEPDVIRILNELGNGKQWGNETIPEGLDADKLEEIMKFQIGIIENLIQADSFRQEDWN